MLDRVSRRATAAGVAVGLAGLGIAAVPVVQAQGGGSSTVRCRGDSEGCTARVSLTGGASNKRVTIRLTDSDLRLVSEKPNRRSLIGSYGLSRHVLREGGSEYAFTLNAVQGIPANSYLTFRFREVD